MGLLDGGPFQQYSAFGMDPKEMQRKAIFNTIAQLGIGLLTGKNWGQGIGQGLLNAQQASQQAQEDAMRQAQFGLQQQEAQTAVEKAKRAQEAEAAKQKAIDDYIASQPPEKQASLRSAAAVGALDNILGEQFKPFRPDIENVTRGASQESGYFDREGKWVSMGNGPRWAPQQPRSPTELETLKNWYMSDDPNLKAIAQAKLFGQGGSSAQTWSDEKTDAKTGRRYIISSRGDRKWLDEGEVLATDPVTGVHSLVNKATGTIRPLGTGQGNIASTSGGRPELAQQPTPLIEDAPAATGAWSNIQAGASETLGQLPLVGDYFTAPETMASRQRVELFAQGVKQALVNNDRFPVAEQELVASMIPDSGEWIRSESTAKSKVVQLHDYLVRSRAAKVRSLQTAPLSKEGRQRLTDQIADTDRALELMGPVLSEASSGQKDASQELDALLDKPSDQWTPEDFKRAEELSK